MLTIFGSSAYELDRGSRLPSPKALAPASVIFDRAHGRSLALGRLYILTIAWLSPSIAVSARERRIRQHAWALAALGRLHLLSVAVVLAVDPSPRERLRPRP